MFEGHGRYGEKGGKGHLPESNQGEKKVVEMRRHWSRFTPKSQSTEHNSYYTCNLALHKPLWRTQSIFLFLFGWWDKASASRERHWPPYRCTALFGTSSFRVRFSIYAFPSLPHFFISCQTTTSSFCSGSCSIPKHCKGASTSPQSFGKFFLFESLYRFFAQAMLDISLSLVWLSLTNSS